MMGWGLPFGTMGGAGWLGALLMLLTTVGLVALVVWGVASVSRSGSREEAHSDSSLDTLKQRYARGEITRDQYLEGRRLLGV